MTDSIKVAVRVRPFNDKEVKEGASSIIQVEGQEVRLTNPDTNELKRFGFHRCYWSTDDTMGHVPVDNAQVFQDIGKEVLNHIYQGYNSTIFAYGQTGAGKSYSIEGYEQKGLLQMCLEDIFLRKKEENSKNGKATSVKITYVEIYNEKLRDLVNPGDRDIRVMQTGSTIKIVGVNPEPCQSYAEVERLFRDGKKIRMVGGHAMNAKSSRSHAVFSIYYKETGGGKMIESQFNIVDLAGSERQSKTQATGTRLQEANNINKSLTNLGIVIETLANNCQKKISTHVPYRNSLLTHLLSESLMGNSKTFMIAAVSPADSNYEETLSTLRFASRASKIETHSKKNVSAKEGYNKELLQEIERLRVQLQSAKGQVIHTHTVSVQYITIEGQTVEADRRITQMVQELDQHKHERNQLEFKLTELEEEKNGIMSEQMRATQTQADLMQRRKQEIDSEIVRLNRQILNSKTKAEELGKSLFQQQKKREELQKELDKALGETTEEQKKAVELNARIELMMNELKQNQADNQQLKQQLEDERKQKGEMERIREEMLKKAGVSSESADHSQRKLPYIMNISQDPTLLGMLIYDLKEGDTRLGTKQADENDIKLNALGISTRHCTITVDTGTVYIEPTIEAKVFINGSLTINKTKLRHLDRITLGNSNNFKLVIPGEGSPDDLHRSRAQTSKYGDYLDDRVNADTPEAKNIKTFLQELEQRLPKHLFAKFIESFKNTMMDVDDANVYTFERYKKLPLRSKNLQFRVNVVVDIANYMKGVPQMIVLCEHREDKAVEFVWTEEKFQDRLADMQAWYQQADKGNVSYYQFDPWFEATDAFIREKEELETLTIKEMVQHWNEKQIINGQLYREILQEQKDIVAALEQKGYGEDVVECYAGYYFRGFPTIETLKAKLQTMHKNKKLHKVIQHFMECCAEVQKCSMDNKYYNEQKEKYGQQQGMNSAKKGTGKGADQGLVQQNKWLTQKIEELQEQIMRRTQALRKRDKDKY